MLWYDIRVNIMCFFFFKQKTAYEMRISDWSSDVCSSDLLYREKDGLRLGELSKRTMVTNGNVTGLVERLEADGLVKRVTPDRDRRVTVAQLTPAGIDLFTVMAAAHEGWLRDIMSDVDPATVDSLWVEIGAVKTSASNHLSEIGRAPVCTPV